jgi:hypothetical protein
MVEAAERYELDSAPFDALVGKELCAFIFDRVPPSICARLGKALEHLTKAEKLRGVDEEMGAIRLIAGEEELVVAIFEWLKLQADHFPEHADFVKQFKRHPVKQSFYPVLSEFRPVIEGLLGSGFTLDGLEGAISWTVTPVVDGDGVGLSLRNEDGKELIRHDPLAIAITRPDLEDEKVADALYDSFAERVTEQGMTVPEFVRLRADFRNQLLYASDEGTVSMKETLDELLVLFRQAYHDLLWTLAVLLGGKPPSKDWGLVVQFFRVYRRVLAEAGLLKAA